MKKRSKIPSQLVHLGFCQSVNIGKPITFKNSLLTSDTSGRTLYILPNAPGREADPATADKAVGLWSKWTGFEKRRAIAYHMKVSSSSASWKNIGLCAEIFYKSDKWSTTGKMTGYVHTFKFMPVISRLGRTNIYCIHPVRVTKKGIEDAVRSNPTKRKGRSMKKDKAAGKGIGPILSRGTKRNENPRKRKMDIRDRDEAMKVLIPAVRRYLDKDQLKDVAAHGADAGWNGFIYYSDTVKFFETHAEAIFKLIEEDAEGSGERSLMKYIGMCDRNDTIADYYTFANFLSWYALESVAHEVTGE